MTNNHTLGMIRVSTGEILTFQVTDKNTPEKQKRISVIALVDIDVSKEMAEHYAKINRSTSAVHSENALISLVSEWVDRKKVLYANEVTVHIGEESRPAQRFADEYRYTINPEQFWEDKLIERYRKASFNVINHQGHLLTVVHQIDSPFSMTATVIDGVGGILGMLRLDIMSDNKHTRINEEDIERLRLGLQADLTMHVPDLMLMIEHVSVQNNPLYGVNPFKQHLPPIVHQESHEAVPETTL